MLFYVMMRQGQINIFKVTREAGGTRVYNIPMWHNQEPSEERPHLQALEDRTVVEHRRNWRLS